MNDLSGEEFDCGHGKELEASNRRSDTRTPEACCSTACRDGYYEPPSPPPSTKMCDDVSLYPANGTVGAAVASAAGASWGDSCYARPADLYRDTNGNGIMEALPSISQAACAAKCSE